MKAVVQKALGGVEVLEHSDIADPVPEAGEVLVQVDAVALNRLDVLQRQGATAMAGFALPHIPGMDVAGVVVDVGPGVDRARIGQRIVVNPAIPCGHCRFCRRGDDGLCEAKAVVGGNRPGGYGALCAVPATHAHPVPGHVDLAEAAAMPTVYSLAWYALFTTGGLTVGETLLVHAAASGVTTAAIQLATRAGARVIVTGRSEDELEHGLRFGAHATIDTGDQDLVAAVRDLTGGVGADMVLDHLGPALFDESIQALRPRGRLVFCGTTTGNSTELRLAPAYRRGIRLLGSESYGSADFAAMLRFCWSAGLRSIVDRQMSITDAPRAHQLMEDGALRGKLILRH
ncbi:zinc-binding dehydrogenase [Sphaerimonospora mesophila]|uniref:zinc-binding dehydrogenase n=1 Tax=Sphaerimonospora mesophila TaxID=37483 RepID=UPI0006E44A1F